MRLIYSNKNDITVEGIGSDSPGMRYIQKKRAIATEDPSLKANGKSTTSFYCIFIRGTRISDNIISTGKFTAWP